MLHYILIFWLLPTLITSLLLIQLTKHDRAGLLEDANVDDWVAIIISSVVYGLGLFIVLMEYKTFTNLMVNSKFFKFLVKTR